MTMRFTNIAKGQVTQALLSSLLERAGYRVTRLGIEELFSEIKHLDLDEYLALKLPRQLRFLPDLLVADSKVNNAYLVEVKFRLRFDEMTAKSLSRDLKKQREYWPGSYAVVMIAESFIPNGKFHQDYIRVIRPNQTEAIINTDFSLQERWKYLPQIYQVFENFDETSLLYDADAITPVIRDLSNLPVR